MPLDFSLWIEPDLQVARPRWVVLFGEVFAEMRAAALAPLPGSLEDETCRAQNQSLPKTFQ